MSTKIRKDDLVEVISGEERRRKGKEGTRGRVLSVNRDKGTVVVEGANIRSFHEKVRPTKEGQSGGLTRREAPIALSKIALVDPKSNKPVRIGTKLENGTRKRVTKGKNASGNVID